MSGIKLPNGMELVFAPGCFDNFEGTQEELDAFIKEISDKFASGEALTEAVPLDIDSFLDELSDEEIARLLDAVGEEIGVEELGYDFPQVTNKRTLQ